MNQEATLDIGWLQAQSPESTQPPPSVMSEPLPQCLDSKFKSSEFNLDVSGSSYEDSLAWIQIWDGAARVFENGKILACKIWGGLPRLGLPALKGYLLRKILHFFFACLSCFLSGVCKISHVDCHNVHALPQGKDGKVSQTLPCRIAQSARSNLWSFHGTGQQNDNRDKMYQIRLTRSAWLEVQAGACEIIASFAATFQLLFLCDVMYFCI